MKLPEPIQHRPISYPTFLHHTHSFQCQVPEKLNIKVRVNKGQLADHDLWHSDQATVDLTLRVAGLDYKN